MATLHRIPLSPRRDGDAAPLLRLDVAHGLGQLPAVAARVLEHARTFAILVRRRFLEDASAGIMGARERPLGAT